MIVKKTSRNRITLPREILGRLPETDCFDVSLRQGAIVLRPFVIEPSSTLEKVRRKVRGLGVTEKDVRAAVRWARRRARSALTAPRTARRMGRLRPPG